jgi:Ras-related GTP-binding protein C/D
MRRKKKKSYLCLSSFASIAVRLGTNSASLAANARSKGSVPSAGKSSAAASAATSTGKASTSAAPAAAAAPAVAAGGGGANIGVGGEGKPKILLMGLRRSGKTSIQKVVFHKMSPNETLFLESTSKIVKNEIANSSFVQLQIWDFPGQLDFFDGAFDTEAIFSQCGALIFVIDAQDDYSEALAKLHMTVVKASKVNPNISYEVFIHKVDGISDDHKIDAQRDIQQQAMDELADAGLDGVHLSFYLTSIYDHSIFEAFSKVVQKLVRQLPTLENLLDILISSSRIEKSFLIDVVSKIYVATDSAPVDMQTYELCSDMIDVVVDVSSIYGLKESGEGIAYDAQSQSIIKLNNGMVLYLREVNKYLALVCLIRQSNFEKHGLIDYNFNCFKQAIAEIFEGKQPPAAAASAASGAAAATAGARKHK